MVGKNVMFFRNAWKQLPQLFGFAMIYGTAIFFLLYQMIRSYESIGLKTSIGDCYVVAGRAGGRIIVDIPVFIVLTVVLIRNKRNLQYLIQWKKRTCIWLAESMEMAVSAAFLSIVETILTGVYGGFLTGCSLNWEEQGSLFWYMTGKTYTQGALCQVILCFWAASFTIYLFTGTVVLLLEWLSGSFILGICLCIGLAAAEDYTPLQVVYGKADLFYERWLLGSNGRDILCVAAVTAVLILAGLYTAKRKEFYGKKQ